jgi:opacity protein-like surface antigen
MDTFSVRQHRVCEPHDEVPSTAIAYSALIVVLVQLPFVFIFPLGILPLAEAQDAENRLPTEVYVSGFVTRSSPTGSNISLEDDKIPQASFGGATGGGLKVGIFPGVFKSILGGEIEVLGHGGKITAPQTDSGGIIRSTDQKLTFLSAMGNVIARYPGDMLQPYIGAGLGLSIFGLNGQTQSSAGIRGSEDSGFGVTVQAIAGVRVILTNHIFGFAEYKHAFSTGQGNDGCGEKEKDCRPLPAHDLDFQVHYVSVGIGFRF